MSSLSNDQLWLLKAALCDQDEAALAWLAFCKKMDIQNLEPSSYNLLPLVYQNLHSLELPFMALCKGVYRHTWCENQLKIRELQDLQKLFLEAKIEVTLLKGLALIFSAYQNPGLRVMGDTDLLVPKEQARRALYLLESTGWKMKVTDFERQNLPRYIRHTHALMLEKEGRFLDLHWSLFSDCGLDPLLRNYEMRTRCVSEKRLPAPEEMLLHLIYHGQHRSRHPLIRFIPDVVFLLRSSPDFCWNYFEEQSQKLKLSYLMNRSLMQLEEWGFIKKKRAPHLRISIGERLHFRFLTRRMPGSFRYEVERYWFSYVRNRDQNEPFGVGFLRYIKNQKEYKSWSSFLLFIIKRGILVRALKL